MRRRCFVFALVGLLISGCGFQLRGSFNLPPDLKALTVDGHDPYSPLLVQIRELLNSAGIATPDDAPHILYVSEEELGKNRFTQNQNVLLDEYMLTHTATFELQRRDRTLIMEPQDAIEMTLFQDDQSTAGTKLNEENILRMELAQKLAVKILRKIQSVKPQQWQSTAGSTNTKNKAAQVATETLPSGETSDAAVINSSTHSNSSTSPTPTVDDKHAPAP